MEKDKAEAQSAQRGAETESEQLKVRRQSSKERFHHGCHREHREE
jgi:hypothetical protein